METFKVGDHVYSEEDFISGEIVEINGDSPPPGVVNSWRWWVLTIQTVRIKT